MHDQGNMDIVVSGKRPQFLDCMVLLEKSIQSILCHSHHELQIVYHNMVDVVDISCMRHGLKKKT